MDNNSKVLSIQYYLSEKVINLFLYTVLLAFFLLGLFFPYANSIGIKWQIISILIVGLLLLQKQIKITELDLIILLFAFLNAVLFYFSSLSIHANLFLGSILSIALSKMNLNYKFIFIFLTFNLLFHHIYFEIFPWPFDGVYYSTAFNSLNQFMGVNRSSVFLLFTYIVLWNSNSVLRYLIIPFILVHTSRWHVLLIIALEVIKNKLYKSALLILFMFLIVIYVFDTWMADFYFFRLDVSIIDRISRNLNYLQSFGNNFMMPNVNPAYEAMHLWPVEIIYYTGIFGIVLVLCIFITQENRFQWALIFICLSGAKTLHDLLLYHVFIAYFISQCSSRNLFIINNRK